MWKTRVPSLYSGRMSSTGDTPASGPGDDERQVRFGEIWAQHEAGVRALIRAKVANAADTEDLFQEVQLRTYNKLETIRSNETMSGWLFRLTRNAIVDHHRKQNRRQPPAESSQEHDPHEPDVVEALGQCVAPFIRELPDDLRKVLTAVDLEGVPQKEYAETHGMKYSTLKSKVQRGRVRLRELFEDCCSFSRDCRGNINDFEPR